LCTSGAREEIFDPLPLDARDARPPGGGVIRIDRAVSILEVVRGCRVEECSPEDIATMLFYLDDLPVLFPYDRSVPSFLSGT
jgi:hypothetical protein